MPRQLPSRPDGKNPLIYMGTVPNMVIMQRRPNPSDGINWQLGYMWAISTDVPSIGGEMWWLASVAHNIATWIRMGSSVSTGAVIKTTYITAAGSGTFTFDPKMTQVTVECIGGGGSSNTQDSPFDPNIYINTPGGGGAYCRRTYTVAQVGSSQSYTIGSGGIAPASGTQDGVDGQDTTFSSGSLLMTAGGGGGGIIPTGTPPPGRVNEGGLGGTASGGDLNVDGTDGSVFYGKFPGATPVSIIANGVAGNSFYGVGAYAISSNVTPVTAVSGAQGAGGGLVVLATASPGQIVGGNGGDGLIIVTEYLV